MGFAVRLAIAAALSGLFLAGCSETGTPRESTYHITCWSSGIKIYEGEGTDIGERISAHRINFYNEDGQYTTVYGDCLIEENINRNAIK